MYQVAVNNKYYVSELSGTIGQCFDGMYTYFDDITLTRKKYEAKFFEDREEAESIANIIGGKVIEYIEKPNIQMGIKF